METDQDLFDINGEIVEGVNEVLHEIDRPDVDFVVIMWSPQTSACVVGGNENLDTPGGRENLILALEATLAETKKHESSIIMPEGGTQH